MAVISFACDFACCFYATCTNCDPVQTLLIKLTIFSLPYYKRRVQRWRGGFPLGALYSVDYWSGQNSNRIE